MDVHDMQVSNKGGELSSIELLNQASASSCVRVRPLQRNDIGEPLIRAHAALN